MKILLYGINYSPELTGIGKYSGEMARWLAAQGHDVRVVTGVGAWASASLSELDGWPGDWAPADAGL